MRHCARCGGLNRKVVDGLSCWNCGELVMDSTETVMIFDPKMMIVPPSRVIDLSGNGAQSGVEVMVVKFYDSIVLQRAGGASWDVIARLLKLATGERVYGKGIQKCFAVEQGRRCADGDRSFTKERVCATDPV